MHIDTKPVTCFSVREVQLIWKELLPTYFKVEERSSNWMAVLSAWRRERTLVLSFNDMTLIFQPNKAYANSSQKPLRLLGEFSRLTLCREILLRSGWKVSDLPVTLTKRLTALRLEMGSQFRTFKTNWFTPIGPATKVASSVALSLPDSATLAEYEAAYRASSEILAKASDDLRKSIAVILTEDSKLGG